MKKLFFSVIPVLALAVIFSSCSKNSVEPDPTMGLTKVADGFVPGAAAKVSVYTNSAVINTGYQKFWFILTDSVSGKYIDDAHIHLMPMMDMGMMKHSAPYENPASEDAVNHKFEGAVMFIMPSTAGTWTLQIMVHNHPVDKEGTITLPLTVTEPAKKRMFSFTSAVDNTSNYFVSLVEPARPKVGINDLELIVFKKQSMMAFPADSALGVSFVPEMPSMGHSSPNNVNPTHNGMGHYKGKVNFTMTGLWRLHFDLKKGDALAKTDSLDIEF